MKRATRDTVAVQIPAKRLLLATVDGFVTSEFLSRRALDRAISEIEKRAKADAASKRRERRTTSRIG